MVGRIVKIKHTKWGVHGICRGRFNKQPKPLYNVKTKGGKIKFQIVLPVYQSGDFCGLKTYWDEDYLAVVRKVCCILLCCVVLCCVVLCNFSPTLALTPCLTSTLTATLRRTWTT